MSFTHSVVSDYPDKFGINKLQFGFSCGFLFVLGFFSFKKKEKQLEEFKKKLSAIKMFLQKPSHLH